MLEIKDTSLSNHLCLYCNLPVKKKGRKYCSVECNGFAKRGRARGNPYQIAKNHTRISLGKDLTGKTLRAYLHRFVIETQVRPLREGEVVHHKDENKFNNDISNLEILSSQSEHKQLHHKLDRDKEVIQDFTFETDESGYTGFYF